MAGAPKQERGGDPLLVSEVVWASLRGMVALLIDHPGYPRSEATLAIDELVEQIVRGASPDERRYT